MTRNCVRCKKLHDEITKLCHTCKEYNRAYCETHKNRKAEYDVAYHIANKAEIAVKRAKYREDNKEDIKAKKIAYANTREGKLKILKSNAKNRNIMITMTDDEIMNMTDMQCEYCGIEPIYTVMRNGIDRMDSSKGYELDNCVPCCHMCNMMKGEVDPLTFVERCAHVSYVNGGPGKIAYFWSCVNKMLYSQYKWSVVNRGDVFDLTKNEYEDLRAQNCIYCHRPSNDKHFNGIDRMDSSKGYELGNCVSCCRDCNMMKRSYSVNDFINQCIKITGKTHVFPVVPRVLSTFLNKL